MERRVLLNYDAETMRTLEKQGYHFVGKHRHSAVKSCLWLKKALRGEGRCYKGKFYGIASHRCVQMTPSIFCNQRCVHCWRPIEFFNIHERAGEKLEEITAEIAWDSPSEVANACIEEQKRLVSGYKGFKRTTEKMFEEAMSPKHVAISLVGEPTLYPYLRELIEEFHRLRCTTFVVTNGTHPEVLRRINPTQLYLSLNAPNEEIYKKISGANFWERILESLEVLREKGGFERETAEKIVRKEEEARENARRTRTVVRITCINGLNMVHPEKYAELIAEAMPDFVEVKAYMHLGFSRKRLKREAMPSHALVKAFAEKIVDALRQKEEIKYKIVDESEISRVVLISSGKEERFLRSAEQGGFDKFNLNRAS